MNRRSNTGKKTTASSTKRTQSASRAVTSAASPSRAIATLSASNAVNASNTRASSTLKKINAQSTAATRVMQSSSPAVTVASKRTFSSGYDNPLKARVAELAPAKKEELVKINKEHGNKIIDTVTVSQLTGGMRGIKSMLWDVSLLDAHEGIRFRGKTIPEIQAELPGAKRLASDKKGEPTPEATLWFLMTGEVPTQEQVDFLTQDLHARSKLPNHVINTLKSMPKETHPMTQFVAGIAAAQTESKFAKSYGKVHKKDLWESAFEDSLDVIARVPRIAAHIYNNTYGNGVTPDADTSLDITASFNRSIGFNAEGKPKKAAWINENESKDAFDEYMRLYFTIHSDHEGGNVSAHGVRLISSALSDPYLSLSAGMAGLAGPLHGLANQEVLDWTLKLQDRIKNSGKPFNHDTVREMAWETLNGGQVIPGFGHAVLRKTDPRYTSQREFALKNMPNDELFQLVSMIYEVVPDVLTQHGKTKNPWPNVDSHSGVCLHHYGLTETNFYTVLFGVSRSIGTLSQLTWDRILGAPIERPKSLDTGALVQAIAKSPGEKM